MIFKNADDVSFDVKITIKTIKDLRNILSIDLLETTGKVVAQLSEDPIMLADVLYVCCKEEAEKKDISDEKFGIGLRGEAIDSAVNAFIEEFINFFPKQKAALLRRATNKSAVLKEKAILRVEKQIDEMDFNPSTK